MLMGMRALLAAALLLLAAAAKAGDAALPLYYSELPPGRYAVEVRGMICTVDARAIAAEWAKLPEVEKASVDFEHERAVVSVRLDKTLTVAALRKALRRAERVANMGGRYELRAIQYIP